jgi:hypothetical protein
MVKYLDKIDCSDRVTERLPKVNELVSKYWLLYITLSYMKFQEQTAENYNWISQTLHKEG